MKTQKTVLALSGALILSAFALDAQAPRSNEKHYTEIKTMAKFEEAQKATEPTIITFKSPTCEACDFMEPSFNAAAKDYSEFAKFYVVDSSNPKLAGLPKKLRLKAYPTTLYIKNGREELRERGAKPGYYFDRTVYKFVHGKEKPLEKPATTKKTKRSSK